MVLDCDSLGRRRHQSLLTELCIALHYGMHCIQETDGDGLGSDGNYWGISRGFSRVICTLSSLCHLLCPLYEVLRRYVSVLVRMKDRLCTYNCTEYTYVGVGILHLSLCPSRSRSYISVSGQSCSPEFHRIFNLIEVVDSAKRWRFVDHVIWPLAIELNENPAIGCTPE